jgi:DNA-binding response OmpR family regulator
MATATKTSTKRVLVVDDDPDIVTLVTDLLAAKGYDVATAPDGLEGILSGIEIEPLDLVILDIMMPKADGLGVLNALKAIRPNLPVILLTAKTAEEDIREGFRWDCDVYMTKPFNPDVLLSDVERLIGPTSK